MSSLTLLLLAGLSLTTAQKSYHTPLKLLRNFGGFNALNILDIGASLGHFTDIVQRNVRHRNGDDTCVRRTHAIPTACYSRSSGIPQRVVLDD